MTLSSSGLTASHAPVKVSVLMITYNHEPFIAQAIESILMQVRDFDYEIVIGEDCSTDATRDIVLRYAGSTRHHSPTAVGRQCRHAPQPSGGAHDVPRPVRCAPRRR
jgi:cellulose synthase/poly-beta-1,6-N-acetylglucosamine synthase-like glycosyltransferase